MPEKKKILYFSGYTKPVDNINMYTLVGEVTDAFGSASCHDWTGRFLVDNYALEIHVTYKGENLTGYTYDEIFGTNDPDILARLKDPNKPRFEGSILDYIRQLAANPYLGDEKSE